jgi:catechol 2,3-dioxygenase-like lactoylglutathione lyase family enzyme
MANRFGADILIQAPDPKKAALFYVNHLGFEITDNNPKMMGLHGQHINLFIEPGPPLGPVLEVTVGSSRPQSQLNGQPRLPFTDDGACPFGGCQYGEWTAGARVVARRDANINSPVVFAIQSRENNSAQR